MKKYKGFRLWNGWGKSKFITRAKKIPSFIKANRSWKRKKRLDHFDKLFIDDCLENDANI